MGAIGLLVACPEACPLVAGVRLFVACPLLSWRVPCLLSAFSCFALGAMVAYMPLFRNLRRFSAGFGVVVWVCIACVLCVACGAFVRVWS